MSAQLFPAVLVSGCLSLVPHSASNDPVKQILRARDLRDARGLLKFLESSQPHERERAAIAAGSVQDTLHLSTLLRLLDDTTEHVRKAAAFALGQMNNVVDSMQRRATSRGLMNRLLREQDEDVLLRIIEALGKCGNGQSLHELVAEGETWSASRAKHEVALSVGRYAYRGIRNDAATDFVARLLESSDEANQWKSAYALMRIGKFPDHHVGPIVAAAGSRSTDTRIHVAAALAKVPDVKRVLGTLIALSRSDPDWRVRTNGVKSLGLIGPSVPGSVIPILLQAIGDSSEHVSCAAIASLAPLDVRASGYGSVARNALMDILNKGIPSYSPAQLRESAAGLARLFGTDAYEFLSAKSRNIPPEAYIAALGHVPSAGAREELLANARGGNPRYQRLALDALVQSHKYSGTGDAARGAVREALLHALSSQDMSVITTAATALSDSLFLSPESPAYLIEALARLRSPNDVEPMVAIIQTLGSLKASSATAVLTDALDDPDRTVALAAADALGQISRKSYRHLVPPNTRPTHTNFDWPLLERARRNPLVEIHTSRGHFRVLLHLEEAPFTCINFATLIKDGFFNGLTFHRVVPNFVIQGGDPRGDGWGGPGYSIRSEFGYSTFERGSVGVASAGKDTEGCQFFVTHSSQPHLDGRYTIFGHVVSGMEVVDLIQVGDSIRTMSLAPE
jgi:peptidylprolyl isomerase